MPVTSQGGFTKLQSPSYNLSMLDIVIVLLCLSINAAFSAYEMAFVIISKEDIEELNDQGKKSLSFSLQAFKKKPERTLSVIQIGITLVGFIAAAIGGTGAAESLEPYLIQHYALSATLAEAISVSIVILPLTYFSVVFGELLPKTIALRYPHQVLTFGTKSLELIDKILSPIVSILEISTNTLLKLLKISPKISDKESISLNIDLGSLPPYHQKFVQNLVSLKGRQVIKSLVPLEQVVYFNYSDEEEVIRKKIKESHHSRFPVIDDDVIVGIFHVKIYGEVDRDINIPWQGILRPALVISEKEKVLEAFLKMQEKRQQIAVVINEENHFIGIITLENILEEIVGDIHDDLDRNKITALLSNRSKIKL